MNEINLLIVDDETEFRQTIIKRLIRRGMNPSEAASGEEALKIIEKKPFDVVVLDIKMPGINGIETLNLIKKKYKNKTEIILLTGHASTEDGVEGIKSGAFDYLTKPVEFEHLLTKIIQAHEKIKREEEKDKEKEFREQIEKQMITTERLASLGVLAAGIAHEINNPLAIINESAGWLKSQLGKENAELRNDAFERAITNIEKSVTRAKIITHQLLGHARKAEFNIQEINLSELFDEVTQMVTSEAKHRNIELIKVINDSNCFVWSDPNQLRQVLINLVSNSLQAIDKNGKISLKCAVETDQIIISVIDTGPGIPKENLEKIFEPFFTTKAPNAGTGLGLSVSRNIIENLNGKIDVSSKLGIGVTFRITIPKIAMPKNPSKDESAQSLEDLIKNYKGNKSND